jgi:hypothetical protein
MRGIMLQAVRFMNHRVTRVRLTAFLLMLGFVCAGVVSSSGPVEASTKGGTKASAEQVKSKRSRRPRITAKEIREAEQLLSDLGYWTGKVDGVLDTASRQALVAFQKVEGREPKGRLTYEELQAIRDARRPEPLEDGYPHVEVDIARQVLFVVGEDGTVERILPVSTGNNKHFTEKGFSSRAYTPRGRFAVERKVPGWRESVLGLLYYPNYILGGIAIHGSPSMPPYPDSHGCIRIPMFAAKSFSELAPTGTSVLVHEGGSFANVSVPWPDEKKKEGDKVAVR